MCGCTSEKPFYPNCPKQWSHWNIYCSWLHLNLGPIYTGMALEWQECGSSHCCKVVSWGCAVSALIKTPASNLGFDHPLWKVRAFWNVFVISFRLIGPLSDPNLYEVLREDSAVRFWKLSIMIGGSFLPKSWPWVAVSLLATIKTLGFWQMIGVDMHWLQTM